MTVAWDGGTTATPTPAYLTSLGPLSGHSSSPPSPPSQFMSLHNVGDYLVEVPTELAKRVPKDWAKVGGRATQAGQTHCAHTVAAAHLEARPPTASAHLQQPSWAPSKTPPPQVNSVKKGVRFRPPEVAAGLQRLELAREHLAVRAGMLQAECRPTLMQQGLADGQKDAAPMFATLLHANRWRSPPAPPPQVACTKAWQQFLGDFGARYLPFRGAVQALAALDCLGSLAMVASAHG